LFTDPHTAINVADPKVFIGLLIGGSIGSCSRRSRFGGE